MEFYCSISNLNNLKQNILTMQVKETEIAQFVQEMSAIDSFDRNENTLLVFEICYLLSLMNIDIPTIKMTLSTIPAKIILTQTTTPTALTTKAEEKCCEPQEKECCKPQENVAHCPNIEDLEQIKAAIIKKWSPFSKTRHPNLKFPEPGDLGNVQFVADDIIPDQRFHCDVSIDHEGNIVRFVRGPVEIVEQQSYEQIYAGLVGKLLDYQK